MVDWEEAHNNSVLGCSQHAGIGWEDQKNILDWLKRARQTKIKDQGEMDMPRGSNENPLWQG